MLYTHARSEQPRHRVGLDYLQHGGIEWSPHPTERRRAAYQRVWSQLGGRAIEELIDLPLMTDPASLATRRPEPALFAGPIHRCQSLPGGLPDARLAWITAIATPLPSPMSGSDDRGAAVRRLRGRLPPRALGCELVQQRGLGRFQAGVYLNFGIWSCLGQGISEPAANSLAARLMRRENRRPRVCGDLLRAEGPESSCGR